MITRSKKEQILLDAREELPIAFEVEFLCTNCNNRWKTQFRKYDEVSDVYAYHKDVLLYMNTECPKCFVVGDRYIKIHDRKPL